MKGGRIGKIRLRQKGERVGWMDRHKEERDRRQEERNEQRKEG